MHTLKSKLSVLSGVVGISMLATTAAATPISLVYNGASVTSGQETATITVTPGTPTADFPIKTSTVYAYGFNMTNTNTDTSGTLGSFLAWCLDVYSNLSTSSDVARSYTITDDPFGNSYGLSDTEKDRVQNVFDANFGGVTVTNGVQAAGFQLALWNAVYDTDWNVDQEGVFKAAASNAVINQANTYLSAADGFTGNNAYRLSFLESTPNTGEVKYQNLVTVSPVPLPAAGVLLLAALGGLGFAGRRRKSA